MLMELDSDIDPKIASSYTILKPSLLWMPTPIFQSPIIFPSVLCRVDTSLQPPTSSMPNPHKTRNEPPNTVTPCLRYFAANQRKCSLCIKNQDEWTSEEATSHRKWLQIRRWCGWSSQLLGILFGNRRMDDGLRRSAWAGTKRRGQDTQTSCCSGSFWSVHARLSSQFWKRWKIISDTDWTSHKETSRKVEGQVLVHVSTLS